MKRRHMLGLLGSAPLGMAFTRYSQPVEKKVTGRKKYLVEAHRGNSGQAPENTLISFHEAIQIGVDRVEADLEFTADEQLIVLHDNSVDRTTNGTGKAAGMAYSEIRKLDAGSWKAPKYAGEYVPLLGEVFELCKGKVMINIDLKNIKAVPKFVKLVKDMGMSEHVVMTGLIPQATSQIRELGENLTMFYESSESFYEKLNQGKTDEAIRTAVTEARRLNLPGFLFKSDWVTPEVVYLAHCHGLAVNVWSVDTLERAEKMFDADVDAIMTDYPELFV